MQFNSTTAIATNHYFYTWIPNEQARGDSGKTYGGYEDISGFYLIIVLSFFTRIGRRQKKI